MEIERKFLIDKDNIPDNLNRYEYKDIEQGYLSTEPVVRVRKSNDKYTLTYKSKGFLVREEYNLPLTRESYEHLIAKADGNIITKRRYLIPEKEGLTIELDIFDGKYKGLVVAEVEFNTENEANSYVAPEWFGEDVTMKAEYSNSNLALTF